ncbi:lactonase family protein [Mucilaginibacter sp. SD-g]|uniref:Lactonase family protein n=2 Tax=Mucilaginibacter segetis TaxID=2793071 RepID=A0A934PRB1_9SPHI|nr:lactonase family protein [Mucilaginibacter segetis]
MLFPVLLFAQKNKDTPKTLDLIIGTYTSGSSKGISVYRFYTESGRVAYLSQITGVDNPSYLCVSDNNKFVYAVNEETKGGVSSFSFDPKSGKLGFINKQSSLGADPCYISVDKDQKNLFVANYSSGNIAVFPLNKDGSIAPGIQTIHDDGHGPNKDRQEKAHVHTAVLSPDEKYVLYTDLGTDKLNITRYKSSQSNPIRPVDPPFVKVTPGNGPRHIAFSPDEKHLYLIQEMGSAITLFDYKKGHVTAKQTVSLLPEGFKGETGAADIHISPDGKFLYASNRGDANEIIVYAINQDTGELTYVDRTSSKGKGPRNFVIDPTGSFLLVANQNSNTVYVFRIDKNSGKLTPTSNRIDIGNPVCLKFAPAE